MPAHLLKTPLQLCNNVGIIDSGYRGHLMSYFANHTQLVNQAEEVGPHTIKPFTRLTQICHPCLTPFIVEYTRQGIISMKQNVLLVDLVPLVIYIRCNNIRFKITIYIVVKLYI